MAGSMSLRRIQLGREATAGTAVDATTLWRGMGTIEDTREKVWPEEAVGILGELDNAYEPRVGGKMNFDSVEASFEQINHLFEMGIKNVGSGVADGGGSGYIYDYSFATTIPVAAKTYTIEAGDDQRMKKMEYCFAETITLEGRYGEALKASATVTGRQVTGGVYTTGTGISFVNATSTISDTGTDFAKFLTGDIIKVSGSTDNDGVYTVATGGVAADIITTEALVDESAGATVTVEDWFSGGPTGLTIPATEEILFSTAKVYIDAVAGTIGTTQVADTVKEMSLKITTGIQAQETASGAKYFSHIEYGPCLVELEITMLYNANAVAEERNWENSISRMIRLNFEGTALGTAGTTYTYKTLNVDMAGSWIKFDTLEDDNGIDTVKGTFKVGYNSTAAMYANIVLVNELATVP